MMSPAADAYTIRFTADAKRDVQSLDGSIKKQLRKLLEKKLAFHPAQYGDPLVGVLKGFWSHHFAAHRVVYRIYDDLRFVLVCAVGPRRAGHTSDVYRQFEALVEAGRTAQQILEVFRSLSNARW
jgi:mRNA-degrading endonuclease RelE of RelBE toxin-antitoxin system